MNSKTKKTKPAEPEQGGYKGMHVEGSRKGKVHELFDRQGAEAAWTLGTTKLKLKPGTLRSWFGQWGRADAQAAKPKAKPAPKSKLAKAIPVESVKVNGGAVATT
jgi:hypothetical protein